MFTGVFERELVGVLKMMMMGGLTREALEAGPEARCRVERCACPRKII